jgi:branched-chain amino acid transport system ATP-binding protein
MNILEVKELSIRFGGVKAVQDVSLSVKTDSITSIIGPNGAGKTTFFNLISGVYAPTSGQILFDGQDITGLKQHQISLLGISRTFQNIRLFNQLSILENVQSAMDARATYNLLDSIMTTPKKRRIDRENREKSLEYLRLVGLEKNGQDKPGSLPYGMQRKVELARALASQPKLLLLDEPAAGLNPTEVEEFIRLIHKIKETFHISILLIEHRLQVVHTLSDMIYVLNFGQLLAHGTSREIIENRDVVAAYMGEDD